MRHISKYEAETKKLTTLVKALNRNNPNQDLENINGKHHLVKLCLLRGSAANAFLLKLFPNISVWL